MPAIGASVSPWRIPLFGARKNATHEVARLLTSGTNVALLWIGDSLTTRRNLQRWEEVLCTSVPSVKWGGAFCDTQVVARTGKYTVGGNTGVTGDDRVAMTGDLSGHYADEYFPGRSVQWATSAAVDPGTTFFAYLLDKFTIGTHPLIFSRASGLGLDSASCYLPVVGATTPSAGLHAAWAVSRFTVTGQVMGDPVAPAEGGFSLPSSVVTGLDFSTGFSNTPSATHTPGTAMTAGTIALAEFGVRACPGVTVWSWSIAGRSIDGWLTETALSDFHLQTQVPALVSVFGTPILWISIGRNNIAENDKAAHKAKLISLISNWREKTGGYWVALDSQYKSLLDPVGTPTYAAEAAREVSIEVPGVAFFDTQTAMGEASTYSEHLDATGHLDEAARISLLGPAYDSLIAAAAAAA